MDRRPAPRNLPRARKKHYAAPAFHRACSMIRLVSVLATFALIALFGADAFACTCEKNIKPIEGSKMIFWGKAKQITPRGSQDRVEFEVTQVFKGDERPAVSLYSNRFRHDCGFRFQEDKTYMVYAYDFYPRGVATSLCWGTHEAAEAPAEDAWKSVKVTVPEDTELEEALRKAAKDIVPRCAQKHRAKDDGFSLVFSPQGDPMRAKAKKKGRGRDDAFAECVAQGFLEVDDLPRPAAPALIDGWYQKEYKILPIAIDEVPCGEGCVDWNALVKGRLVDADGPDTTDKVSFELKSQFEECTRSGLGAIHLETTGPSSLKARRDRMIADCIAWRGEFDKLDPYLESITDPAIKAALIWAREKSKPAEGKTIYPITRGEETFVGAAIEGKPSPGKLRILRSHLVDDEPWAESPLYLEAFAQSITADPDASPGMRDLAALAYHRAGLLVPEAAAAYGELADAASATAEAKALRDELSAKMAPPVEEAAAAADADAGAAEGAPADLQPMVEEPPKQDPTLLIVAGVLIVAALAGIGTILKRKR